jgi:hypothetical protein
LGSFIGGGLNSGASVGRVSLAPTLRSLLGIVSALSMQLHERLETDLLSFVLVDSPTV